MPFEINLEAIEKAGTTCETCKVKPGEKQFDHGLFCGVHCSECWDEMIWKARSRSW